VYLRSSVNLIDFYKDSGLTEDEIYDQLKKDMFSIMLEKQKSVIANYQPHSGKILAAVSKKSEIFPSSFGIENSKAFNEAIDALVHCNVLRYNKEGVLTWHSIVTKTFFMMK